MKKVLLSTALVAGLIGGVSANQEAAQSALGSVTQFVISDSHAQGGSVPVAGGVCIFYRDRNFRGPSMRIRYSGRQFVVRNFRRNLRRTVSSVRLRGTASAIAYGLINGRSQIGPVIVRNNRRLRFPLDNILSSAGCGISAVTRARSNQG